jgi:hypothetical protein
VHLHGSINGYLQPVAEPDKKVWGGRHLAIKMNGFVDSSSSSSCTQHISIFSLALASEKDTHNKRLITNKMINVYVLAIAMNF